MNQLVERVEFILDNLSGKKFPQWDHSRTTNQKYMVLDQEKLKQLSLLLDTQVNTSRKIQNLVLELVLLLEEQS